jgi:peptidyl-prolyl cis-trans isomerase D
MFDLAKFKEYFKANPASTILKDREVDAELSAKYQIYNTMIKSGFILPRVKES